MPSLLSIADEDLVQKMALWEKDLKSIFAEETQKKYTTLDKYLKEKSLKHSAGEVKEYFEESVRRQMLETAKTQYLHMEKIDNFSEAGEQRVAISFCRLLLDIPAQREVTQQDANLFREEISNFNQKLGNPSAEKLKKILQAPMFKFFDLNISYAQEEKINKILSFLNSDWRYFFSVMSGHLTAMLGQIHEIKEISGKFREKKVMVCDKEIVRMPYSILSMAATTFPKGTIIRRVSCETIFYNKWHSYFETSDFEKDLLLSHDYSNVREAIKAQAFKAYQVNNLTDLNNKYDLFIDEMIEGIIWHELGHDISLNENKFIPQRMAHIGASLSSYGTEAISVLKEALADWAPAYDGGWGPIWHFIQVSKKDYLKAKRMVYVYLSDYWFLDFGEEFMGETTDIVVPLLIQFIDEKGEIDFAKLEKLHSKIFEMLVKWFVEGATAVFDIYQKAVYKVTANQEITYSVLETEMHKMYKNDPSTKDWTMELIQSKSAFWSNVRNYLEKFSDKSFLALKDYLKNHTQKINLELLKRVSGNQPEKYKSSIRNYVVEQMKVIGCYLEDKKLSSEELLENIMEEINFSEDLKQKTKEKINQIESGKAKISVAINYEAKPSPLVAVIQKLMLMSEYGEIKSGMSLGEEIDEDLSEAENFSK
jgi:hypothetical protein